MCLLYKTTYYNLLEYKCYNDGYDSLCAFFLHNSNGRLEFRYVFRFFSVYIILLL